MGVYRESIHKSGLKSKPGSKKWGKNQMTRLRRRQEKQDPENAMRKNVYHGYYS